MRALPRRADPRDLQCRCRRRQGKPEYINGSNNVDVRVTQGGLGIALAKHPSYITSAR